MKKIFALILSLAMMTAVFAGCGDAAGNEAKTITLGGSTSVEKVIQAMMEAYMEDNENVTVTYAPTGSSAGIQGATDGTLDIGLSSRSLKDTEKEGLEEITFALDGIAIIVNKDNKAADLTLDDLKAIFTGEKTNWKDFGGTDKEIVIIGRDAASGTRDGFEGIVGVADACKYDEEQASTGAVVASVSANAGAVGYVSLASVSSEVNVVKIGGIAPSEKTVKDGSYKIQRPFVFAVKEEQSATVKAFLDWAVSSKTTELVTNAGAVAVK